LRSFSSSRRALLDFQTPDQMVRDSLRTKLSEGPEESSLLAFARSGLPKLGEQFRILVLIEMIFRMKQDPQIGFRPRPARQKKVVALVRFASRKQDEPFSNRALAEVARFIKRTPSRRLRYRSAIWMRSSMRSVTFQ
jgi:hypothetical protein